MVYDRPIVTPLQLPIDAPRNANADMKPARADLARQPAACGSWPNTRPLPIYTSPMPPLLNTILLSQFEAALCMFDDCVRKCPAQHWDMPIAKYPFWQVAYHTLCFVDLYLAPNEADWKPRPDYHPAGLNELEWEYPSRSFSQAELLAYTQLCLSILRHTLTTETEQTLAGPCGVARRSFCRAELHIYNLRHVQHHTGQLSAALRRVGVDTNWVGAGWREPQ